MGQYNIHIVSLNKEICSLIMKTLDAGMYSISCTHGDEINLNSIHNSNWESDCVIIDKGLSNDINKAIIQKYRNTPMICLPSLEYDHYESENVRYMSEPFKLSELKKTIDEICPVNKALEK